MTRARAALLLLPLAALLGAIPASAQPAAPSLAMLYIVDRVSFEQLMSVEGFREFARAGGSGLMTTSDRAGESPRNRYQTIGAGAQIPGGRPYLMATILRRNGIVVIGSGPVLEVGERANWLLGDGPSSEARDGERAGDIILFDAEQFVQRIESPTPRREALEIMGDFLPAMIASMSPAVRLLVIVLTPQPSQSMDRVGDEVTPILMAEGRPADLLRPGGEAQALTSDTTRQEGLVANVDVAPTILDFFGIPIPGEMDGQPIELTDGPAPFKLHQLHLDQRRIRLPIQLAEVAFVATSGLVAIVVLLAAARRGSLPSSLGWSLRFLTLCVVALPIPLILGGVLPRLTYWVVVPFLVVAVLGLAVLAWTARWPGRMGPFVFLGLAGMAVLVVDALFGWRGARIPLLGGTMFDGARFYGLPNAFLGLLLASALFVAAALPAFHGFMLLVGAGLFAGFPSLGADIGGAATLLFAAGLWWVLGTRRRFGAKEVAFVAGVVALGVGAVLLANRYLPGAPTHATRFAETTGSSLSDALRAYGDRLSVGFEQVREVPAALIPLLGLPGILALAVARPGPIGWGFDMVGRRWFHVVVVLTLAGTVAFFANDTGVAAAGPVFLYAMSAMAYPAFLAAADRWEK